MTRKLASPPAGRRERHKLRMRSALLSAARTLLAERSIDAISVDEIAATADVAKGTFYNYFADKDAFVSELDRDVRFRLESEIAQVNARIADPVERIARAVCCAFRFSLRERNAAIATARLFPHATDPTAPANAGVARDVAKVLKQGSGADVSADAMITAIVGLATAGVNRAMDLQPDQIEDFVRNLGTILLRGLGVSHAETVRTIENAIGSVLRHS